MCGIVGWYARGSRPVGRDTIQRQCGTIIHRGPDDEGLLIDGDFGFGMRRLSIVDLAGGHQPITTRDDRFAIIANGEIYNHPALRQQLVAAGYPFRTHSDTETILAAWRVWGEAAWAKLEGMFAAAIWDRQTRTLVLARDPLGMKPLYITEQDGGIAFASEIQALLPLPGHRFDVAPRAVHDFFSFGHIRSPRSIYAQVRTLAPGHVLTIGPDGEATERAFWQPRYRTPESRSPAEWIEAFRARWLETVERHMMADVPVGAFLSGGIDSSAVVAAMAQLSGDPVRTFTIGFPVERYNEAPFAERIAHHLGCDHSTHVIDLKAATDILPDVQRCYGEPFADPSAVPTWYVSRIAAEHVKVVLSGDGGDEIFMGYKRHLTERKIGQLPYPVRALARSVMALPSTPVRQWNYVLQRWQKAASSAALPDGISRFFAKTQITSPAFRARIYDPAFFAEYEAAHGFEALRDEYFPDPSAISRDTLEQFAYADLTLNLPGAMLTKVDRASMAHSLEVRVPMLSHDLVDWAMALPVDMKLRDGVGKYIVREAIAPWLPPGILDRRKQGFQMPLAEWFAGDFGGYARELWNDSGAASDGYLGSAAVEDVFREHRSGKRDHSRFLYALSMYSLWRADRATALAQAVTPVTIRTTAPTVPQPANDLAAPVRTAPARTYRDRFGRAAALLLAVTTGWMANEAIGPLSAPATAATTFVDEAVSSHQTALIRAAMRSQPEIADYDPVEIRRATSITMPSLPKGWRVIDAQVYPAASGPSVQLGIRTDKGENLSVFGMRADTPAGTEPELATRRDEHVAYWEEGPLAFALVSTMPAKRLLGIAAQLATQ